MNRDIQALLNGALREDPPADGEEPRPRVGCKTCTKHCRHKRIDCKTCTKHCTHKRPLTVIACRECGQRFACRECKIPVAPAGPTAEEMLADQFDEALTVLYTVARMAGDAVDEDPAAGFALEAIRRLTAPWDENRGRDRRPS